MFSIESLSKPFVRNVVAASMALLVIAVVGLWYQLLKAQARIDELGDEKVTLVRACGETINSIHLSYRQNLEEAAKRMDAIEKKLTQRRK